jgi:hypothetical protein
MLELLRIKTTMYAIYCLDVVLYCIVLYCIVLYCIVLYRIVSYRIVSYRIVSYRIVLYSVKDIMMISNNIELIMSIIT